LLLGPPAGVPRPGAEELRAARRHHRRRRSVPRGRDLQLGGTEAPHHVADDLLLAVVASMAASADVDRRALLWRGARSVRAPLAAADDRLRDYRLVTHPIPAGGHESR